MKITDDIIIDLYPVYQSGEASEDTQALVENYLDQHPELKKLLATFDNQLDVLDKSDPQFLKEKETIMRVKKILRFRSILFGLAMLCTLMPLSIAGNSEEGVTWFMLRDAPVMAAVWGFTAVGLWLAFWWTYRTLAE